ncbi:MIP/aquaporin family protein [Lacticaseibacillus daqingensis]|uniref:MIP/aquaporin family protein n=1 Tax=Lacticaseibacillus daqingensis TaxID=2486014 RepID=UPI000F7B76AF|nr:MIP family channel protein [Lacticaseibacillus daqingensis]
MQKLFAEFMGTFLLVFLGSGAVLFAKGDVLTIAIGFGLAITISAYAFGGISGGHFNPAVTTAMVINGRTPLVDGLMYIVAQIIGAIAASGAVRVVVDGLKLPVTQMAQTDFPKLSVGVAFFVEALATFLFLMVILAVTADRFGNAQFAGLAIGVALMLLIIFSVNLTGASLNPARSIGPALFAGGSALSHLWLYIVAPEVGAIVAAFAGRFLLGTED